MRKEPESMREIHRIRHRMARKWKGLTADRIAAEIGRATRTIKAKFGIRIPSPEFTARAAEQTK